MTTRNLVPLLIFASYHFFFFFRKKKNFFVLESQKRPIFLNFFRISKINDGVDFLKSTKNDVQCEILELESFFLASHLRGEYFVGEQLIEFDLIERRIHRITKIPRASNLTSGHGSLLGRSGQLHLAKLNLAGACPLSKNIHPYDWDWEPKELAKIRTSH